MAPAALHLPFLPQCLGRTWESDSLNGRSQCNLNMASRGARASCLEESYLVMEKEIQGINSIVINQGIYFFGNFMMA